MTNSTKQMLSTQRGLRLKALMKENKEKQETIALALGYAKESISRFCTGKQLLPDTAAEILAKRWDIREEYIKCIDDFKTDLELLNCAEIQNRDDFLCQKKYLETLGFNISLTYTLSCYKTGVYRHKETLLPFLREDSYNEVINDPDFLLSPKEFFKKCHSKYCCYFLKRPLDKAIEQKIESLHKETIFHDDPRYEWMCDTYLISSDESPTGQNCEFDVSYSVIYNGKNIGAFELREIQELFKIIDAYTKFTIETLLVDKRMLCDLR